MERIDACSYIRNHWPEIQKEAINRAVAAISELTADDVCKRFLDAGVKYGEFNPEAINVDEELGQEFMDIPSYVAIEWLQSK